MYEGGGRHSLDLVVDRRQLFVLGGDGLGCRFRNQRIGGKHHGHRLADETHLVDREYRLVVERRTVIGLGDHLADVVGGKHAKDARYFLRRAGVDRLDAAMRHGAAENLAVQHAVQSHQVGIFGSAGHFFARFEARDRTADLATPYRVRRHQ